MNPLPVSWCLGGALAAAAMGAFGGWTVRDWKRDAEVLANMEKATKAAKEATDKIDEAAVHYETARQDAAQASEVRSHEIRTIYRDIPVPADCAVPPAAVRVLDDARTAANARAAGQPAPALPTAAPAAGAADRP